MRREVYGGIYLKMMPDACTHFLHNGIVSVFDKG